MQPPPQAAQPPPVVTLDQAGVTSLANELVKRGPNPQQRAALAIAGVPGSGKSTLANAVAAAINQHKPGSALTFAMDGYHMTNEKLERLGRRDRKGAVHTFEAQQYFKRLAELRDASKKVRVPVFDRTHNDPVYTGKPEHTADAQTRFIITEGNYLLLDTLPWTAIDDVTDLRVWIDIPEAVARQRTIKRHIEFGRTPQEAKLWYETNDQLNASYIRDRSRHADLVARWPKD